MKTDPSPTYPRSEILPGIYLGDFEDALAFNGPKVTVHENPRNIPPSTHWVPILYGPENNPKASRMMLDAATNILRHYQRQGIPVLLHCAVGLERSPLTMAWFLRRYGYTKTLDEAYEFIRRERPQVFDRTLWLESRDLGPTKTPPGAEDTVIPRNPPTNPSSSPLGGSGAFQDRVLVEGKGPQEPTIGGP